jgi:hypothetical protein
MSPLSHCLHGPECGHQAIEHNNHVGFLQDGDLHCFVRTSGSNKFKIEKHELPHTGPCCPPYENEGDSAGSGHSHSDEIEPCGCYGSLNEGLPDGNSSKVLHGSHYDWLVGSAMHHRKGDNCMNHGTLQLIAPEDLERHMLFRSLPEGIAGVNKAKDASLPFYIMLM